MSEPLPPYLDRGDGHNRCCNRRLWCIGDVCGVLCVLITWFLIGYAEYVVMGVILLSWPQSMMRAFHMVVYNALTLLAFSSHARTMLTDPGAVPRGNATKEAMQWATSQEGGVVYKCPKCWSIKPERAHHCSVCQRCIRKMDHHCPWVNNCVGENNQKFFVLFTLYIAAISVHSLILAVNQFVSCFHNEWKACSVHTPPATVIMLLFLIFEGALFGIFTLVMLCSQVQAIWTDETGIEALKGEEVRWRRQERWKSMRAVFGRTWHAWLSPFTRPVLSGSALRHVYPVSGGSGTDSDEDRRSTCSEEAERAPLAAGDMSV
ncbi:palmitoyltransferase ZDHHC3-like isoform X1 [Pollicipes pollicipes]|uniref:palmitoyltransferase ZDHHC3-like isoform X1 n=2 Tax=Pollicipes pollicipes TaxID=41117 RepID=UPI0018849465|nr:palmitoyltransferase ZDHHC3-like isoform X1 [Pollicipes pollicipes]XP_037085081.1 palmitoyltransferase ZDHHC3-like isoform X1 [Pollicipes pollicipes]XP_037085082.1 palmitoyltransferase ZDHHC3-like isoform X1 [Pollicipes pollicipes]